MAQPVVKYDGNYITCYPSSNAADDGKLQLEFNMARLVTRVSSKNFCVVNPSFALAISEDVETSAPIITVGTGQASINGMDLIATQTLKIPAPETAGTYYLAFKLARDSSRNVLGDLIYGTTITFEGVYLTYYTEKDETDKDMLFLGKVTWDGTAFSNLSEDLDKYGRIWAEDVLCKLVDPKHPTVTRILLQNWLYNVPDWYFSKEGDVIYGSLEMLPGRNGSDQPGIKMQAIDEDTSQLIIKAPSVSLDDPNKVIKLEGTDDQVSISLGEASLSCLDEDNYKFNIFNTKDVNIRSYDKVVVQGDDGVEIGSGGTGTSPKLTLLNHKATLTDSNSQTLVYDVNFVDSNTIQNKLGKAIWQYSDTTKNVSLLQTDVNNLEVLPNSIFRQNVNVINTIYLGSSTNSSTTYLKQASWRITDSAVSGKYTDITANSTQIVNSSLSSSDNASILLKNTGDTIHTKIFDDAKIELLNTTRNPSILWKDSNTTYDVTLEKIIGEKRLNIQGNLSLVNLVASGSVTGAGLITTNGTVTFKNGTNDATITKDNNATSLRTSAALYVGQSGTSALYAGNTTIRGSATIGSSGQCVVDGSGNINTSGTITGSKVYNAVYNGFGEIFRKDKDEVIEYGDIVCVRTDGLVHKVNGTNDVDRVIGVCSDTIGIELGGKDIPEEEQVEVEMVGQIWVKTDDELITPGQMVKVLPNGKCAVTDSTTDKFGVTISLYTEGKVRVVVK